MRFLAVVALLLATASCKRKSSEEQAEPARPASLTHGVAAGGVTQRSALLWSRASGAATLHAEVSTGGRLVATGETAVAQASDFAGVISIGALEPGTRYQYTITAESAGARSSPVRGAFATPPREEAPHPVRFAWSGDLAGQNVCRDAARGFPIFEHLLAAPLDFFIPLGDMIYADSVCEATGSFGNTQIAGDYPVATDMTAFWAHWKYNRQDPGYRELLASMAVYPTWDDHEVVNDSGPEHDTREAPPYRSGEHLMPLGLAAFRHYNPVAGREPIYSLLRWGKHLELFYLDNRSYRDANERRDTDAAPKTMLGAAQRAWLSERLRRSEATWLVVVSSVPISIPTGSDDPVARDGWADFGSGQGFERELRAILTAARSERVPNLLWITTDVHFASVFRYQLPGDPGATFHEAIVGPLSAGLFPTRDFDDSFGSEQLFFHGPDSPEGLSYDEAQHWMTYGEVAIDATGVLALSITDGNGAIVYQTRLEPRGKPAR